MLPALGAARPDSTSSSSVWPLPDTPAMPTISPARSCSDTSASRATPSASVTPRPCAASSTSPGCGWRLALRPRFTRRPTMASARPSMLVSAIFVSSTTWPARITVTASHRAMISRSLCVMSRMVVPRSRRPRSVTKSASVSCGVSTAVGSSRMRMRAPRNSAFRISSRWRSPTGSSLTSASSFTCRPVSRISTSSLARTSARATFRRQLGSAPSITLSSALSVSTSMKCWCTMPMPRRNGLAAALDLHGPAFDADLPRIGLVEAVEDGHQRALAGTVFADDAVHRATFHAQLHGAVGVHRAEAFFDALHQNGRGP